jgi:hypothetical protein
VGRVTEERRTSERVHSVNLVSLSILADGDYVELAELGRTLDVSEGGIRLEAFQHVPVGTLARLRIGLREEIMDVDGRVAHVAPVERNRVVTGIEFINVTEHQAQTLRRFLTARTEH